MFEHLAGYRSIIVTGPHRSGTTICAEMIGHDTGLTVYREESFGFRNIIEAEPLIRMGGVFQGPYLLPWLPILTDAQTLVVYMDRDRESVAASIRGLKARGVSLPYFSQCQARRLWGEMSGLFESLVVDYESLRGHPLWREDRKGWGHRQTR